MRNLGIFCSIGGGPSEIVEIIWKRDKFSPKFNSLIKENYDYKSYGSSLEFIGFGTGYISEFSKKKVEIMFSLKHKEFIYSLVLNKKELSDYLVKDVSSILIKSIQEGIAHMKTIDVGDFDVLKMEKDIANVISEIGYNYKSIEANNGHRTDK